MIALLGGANRKYERNWFMAGYTFVLFVLGTYWIASNTRLTQLALVDNRNYPTGPIGYIVSISGEAFVVAGNACDTIANWLVDGLLVRRFYSSLYRNYLMYSEKLWRCYIIYSARRWVIVVPFLMWLGSIGMSPFSSFPYRWPDRKWTLALGILLLYETSRPNSDIFLHINTGLSYFALSTATNVLLTIMISGRLLMQIRHLSEMVGAVSARGLYTSAATMLIESCALYAIVSLIFMGLYGAGTHASEVVLPTLAQVRVSRSCFRLMFCTLPPATIL